MVKVHETWSLNEVLERIGAEHERRNGVHVIAVGGRGVATRSADTVWKWLRCRGITTPMYDVEPLTTSDLAAIEFAEWLYVTVAAPGVGQGV